MRSLRLEPEAPEESPQSRRKSRNLTTHGCTIGHGERSGQYADRTLRRSTRRLFGSSLAPSSSQINLFRVAHRGWGPSFRHDSKDPMIPKTFASCYFPFIYFAVFTQLLLDSSLGSEYGLSIVAKGSGRVRSAPLSRSPDPTPTVLRDNSHATTDREMANPMLIIYQRSYRDQSLPSSLCRES